MKSVINAIWQFLKIIGQYRYQQSKRRGFGMY
jgi:hypothetical protein